MGIIAVYESFIPHPLIAWFNHWSSFHLCSLHDFEYLEFDILTTHRLVDQKIYQLINLFYGLVVLQHLIIHWWWIIWSTDTTYSMLSVDQLHLNTSKNTLSVLTYHQDWHIPNGGPSMNNNTILFLT